MRFASRCGTKAAIFLPIKYFLKNFKTSIFQVINSEKAPSETKYRFQCDCEGIWLHHYQRPIFNLEKGMHIKKFKNIQISNFSKFLKLLKIYSCFIHHRYWFIAHSQSQISLNWRGLSEFNRKNIDDHKSCKINEQRFFLVKKVNFCFQKILLLLK